MSDTDNPQPEQPEQPEQPHPAEQPQQPEPPQPGPQQPGGPAQQNWGGQPGGPAPQQWGGPPPQQQQWGAPPPHGGQPGQPPYPGQQFPGQQYPGQPGQPGQPWSPPPAGGGGGGGKNILAIIGLGLGVVAAATSWIPVVTYVAIGVAVVAIALSVVGLLKARQNGGKGLAIAGAVVGVIALVLAILFSTVLSDVVSKDDDSSSSSSRDKADDEADDEPTDEPTDETETATPDEAGETRENPLAFGDEAVFENWTVVTNSVRTIKQDRFEEKPAKGKVLLEINVTVTYTGNDPKGDSPYLFVEFVTPGGNTINSTDGSTFFMSEDNYTLETLYEGASVTGSELLEVPADEWQDGVLTISPDFMSSKKFVTVQ